MCWGEKLVGQKKKECKKVCASDINLLQSEEFNKTYSLNIFFFGLYCDRNETFQVLPTK